ncbi:MAG: hypothetical protein OXK77_03230 [Gemmatimonadota bacterium]|nr:hypothetical protein [Gemmatimonadota bacterium]MDE2863889.1 hypothetical protein [Gemmatimonadota bacterium]
MTRIFVVDTSYLLELYSVPGFSDPTFSTLLRERMAGLAGARFHVPVGCLYKFCDHISDVTDGNRRHQLAQRIATDVESSIGRARPWLISPSKGLNELAGFIRAFASDPTRHVVGLTNSDVIEVANGLKRKYGSSNYRVHIWTKNTKLKAHEPDREPEPL